jgi:hypothetical protein
MLGRDSPSQICHVCSPSCSEPFCGQGGGWDLQTEGDSLLYDTNKILTHMSSDLQSEDITYLRCVSYTDGISYHTTFVSFCSEAS